jgi:glucose-6-phosphate 1-dehydrogenase
MDSNPQNPLFEENRTTFHPDPCVVIIFGATGDLTSRRLFPALYNLQKDGFLSSHFACVGFARRDKSNESFRDEIEDKLTIFSRSQPIDKTILQDFRNNIFYHKSSFTDDEGYISLTKLLQDIDSKYGTKGNRIFYLSTPPKYFPIVIEKLHRHHLIYNKDKVKNKWSRIIIEKPFGHDMLSAEKLQNDITRYVSEEQIYRIDHYLGKETVQNLLVFRFANSIFESIWNSRHIDHVQITVAEELGVGSRGNFFEEQGILRDIIQNHVLQLLSLVAMEPPATLESKSIHDEKVKVLQSISSFSKDSCENDVVRGQYSSGYINGEEVSSYLDENDIASTSTSETFAAIKLFVNNWRWEGVPFYLRAGKRLPKRATEIAITFKEAPGVLFRKKHSATDPNILTIRIQPNEGIAIKINTKVPGQINNIQPVKMDFCYGTYFGQTPPEAYERLIYDAIIGDSTLFARQDEVINSWRIVTPILDYWSNNTTQKVDQYPSGSWGPFAADNILQPSTSWRLL